MTNKTNDPYVPSTNDYKPTDVAKILCKSVSRIRGMIVQDFNPSRLHKHFPGAYKLGRDWRIPIEDVNAKLAEDKLKKEIKHD